MTRKSDSVLVELLEIRNRFSFRKDDGDGGWKTIKGTHVELSDDGDIVKGPQRLKDHFTAKKEAKKTAAASKKGVKGCSNHQELKNHMKEKYGIAVDDKISELDFETVRDTMEGVESMISEFPELGEGIKYVGILKKGVMACNGTNVYFNPGWYNDPEFLKLKLVENSESGWWPKGSTLASIAVHEMAHALDYLMLQRDDEHFPSWWEKSMAWNGDKSVSKSIISEAVKNIKKTPYGKGKKKQELMDKISKYGGSQNCECLAEAFADCSSNGENANPLSIEIRRLTIERYKQLTGGN